MTETTMSVKGQIVIPLEVRKRLGLKAGQRFEVEALSDGAILIIPIPKDAIDAMELPEATKLERALAEERERDEERVKRMAGELKKQ